MEEDEVVMTDTKPADVEEFKDDGVSAAFLRFDDIDEDEPGRRIDKNTAGILGPAWYTQAGLLRFPFPIKSVSESLQAQK